MSEKHPRADSPGGTSVDSHYQVGGSNWGPTRLSILLPLFVGIGMVGLFIWQIDTVLLPVAIGSAGAIALTITIWLVDSDDEGISTFLASMLTLPSGIGLFGGATAMTLLLVAELFPIEDLSFLSLSSLIIVGHVGVVLGCSLVIFGSTVGLRNIDITTSLQQLTRIALVALVVPGVVALTFVALTVASAGDIAGPAALWSVLYGFLTGVYITTTADALHLSSFLFLLALVFASLRAAIGVLPVAELLVDRNENTQNARTLSRVISVLTVASMGFFLTSILWLFVEQSFTPSELRRILGTTVFETVQTLTTATILRILFAVVAIVLFVTTACGYLLRGVARSNVARLSRRVAAMAGGTVITIGGLWIAQSVYDWLVFEVETRLPEMVAGDFRELSDTFAELYGAETLVVLLLTAAIGLTVTILLLFRLFLFFRYLPTESMGPSVASAGLFIATVFAATIGAPTWLVLAGIVATFVIWDAGRFGITMGAEIGRRAPSRSPEIVHSAATVLVGAVGAGVAVALLRTDFQLTAPIGTVALLSVLFGLLFILESLR